MRDLQKGSGELPPDDPAPLEAQAERAAARLGLLANPKRLLILCRLAEGEASVQELLAVTGLGQSALSQHLARLREAAIVSTRRDGQTIHYSLADPEMRALMAALYDVFCAGLRGQRAQPPSEG
jgi:ArsR family transcriptional regulator, virulence genes transcriptional regulator